MAEQEKCPICGAELGPETITCPQCHSPLPLARQVAHLNERIARLEQLLARSTAASPAASQPRAAKPTKQADRTAQKKRPSAAPNPLLQSDFWLNKIGMALVFLALVFLFNYAVEQGWLTPVVRIGIGLLVGAILLGIGYRIAGHRRHFSQVLAGGGIAIYYLTGFAAFQLYHLTPFWLAFGFMGLVTLLAFLLSLHQKEATFSLLGVIGGLATPFLLNVEHFNATGLIAYTSLIVIVAGLIYLFRGWQLLLWTTSFGGWLILALALRELGGGERWAVQAGVVIVLAVAWIGLVWREAILSTRPSRWPAPRFGFADSLIPQALQDILNSDVYFSALLSPYIALVLTSLIWKFDNREAGWLAVGGALIAAVMVWLLKRTPVRARLWWLHGWTSALQLALALLLIPEDTNMRFLALTVEAALLQGMAQRWSFPVAERIGVHAFWALLGAGLLVRLTGEQQGIPLFNIAAIIDLIAIVLAVFLFREKPERMIYWPAAHIAFLIWLWGELSAIVNGQGLVSVAWGVYALALLGLSLIFHARHLRLAGIATLFLLAAKLILIDLSEVRAIWRVLLFAGVGGFFLMISYFYRSLFVGDENEPEHEVEKRS